MGAPKRITMIDTNTTVATVILSSTFDRSAASLLDRDADDLDRLAASLHWLAHYCDGEPFVIEASKDLRLEPMGDHEPISCGITGEQF
jgi:hypothetical protein